MNTQHGALVAALLLGMAAAATAAEVEKRTAPQPVRIELFSPQGSVKEVRQATARFSAAMVALGDPRLADPFEVSCAAAGKGRWADGRNWVYDFDADLPAGLIRSTPAARRS